MKKIFACVVASLLLCQPMAAADDELPYVPSPENLESRQEFADAGLGVFIHWGLYSMFAQGEWFLNYGVNADEYAKAASAFYPARFDAAEWVSAIKASGAKYICITTRHHDGFSMWHTAQSPYNIVDATPFGRDILKELADECVRQGMRLHFYYSHIDWTRPDYPRGRTGLETGCPRELEDWDSYYGFMNRQLNELLTRYGPVGAIWFDGKWDHDQDSVPFNWQLREQYDMIHRLQPRCLIGNNHHEDVYPGEDIQIFERDVPGQNTAGYSEQAISLLPLETCQTMNGMWGYKIKDQNYKSVDEIVRLLVSTAGQGANLLLNVGPQPNGELPQAAVERLRGLGEWMGRYGESVYATTAGDFPAQEWGVATRKGDTLYVHVFDPNVTEITVPIDAKIKCATDFDGSVKIPFRRVDGGYRVFLPERGPMADYIVKIVTK